MLWEGGTHTSGTRWEELGVAALPGALVSATVRHRWRGGFSVLLVPRASDICACPELLTAPRGGLLLPVSSCGAVQKLDGGMPRVSPPIPQNTGVRQARTTCNIPV